MTTPGGAAELAQLAGIMLTAADLDEALVEVTRVSVRAVDAADGCSITMRTNGPPAASSADDDWAMRLDKMQFVEQEGPCLDCLREGVVIRVLDLADEARFPSWGPRARDEGARSALSLPLTADGRTVGALDLYAREPRAFGPEQLAFGQLLAAHASLAVQAATAYYSSRELAEQMRRALRSRAVIDQAKGIVMARQGCDAETAFDLLVRESQRANRKLRDVAQGLVDEAARGPGASAAG